VTAPSSHQARQASLWESRVQRAFDHWILLPDGRRVESEVVKRARRLKEAGNETWGIAAIFESIRYDAGIGLLGDAEGYRINNNHRSHLARRVMALYPDLAGFFTTRDLHGRVA